MARGAVVPGRSHCNSLFTIYYFLFTIHESSNAGSALDVPANQTSARIENPENSLRVFNRWGDEIFSAEPYNNDWDGTADGEPVPAGTYFYLFYPDRSTEDDMKAGYIKVVR